MFDSLAYMFHRFREQLWVKPLLLCIISILVVLYAAIVDFTPLGNWIPDTSLESIQDLLKIMASSMLVIATFAVASMVSAYASASNTATPRTFSLVIADDVSQNALSTFIGAFIYSIVALVALENGYFEVAGRFVLLVVTLFVLAMVILVFVRWTDRIARLGRLGTTIDKVEETAAASLLKRRRLPGLGGVPVLQVPRDGIAVFSEIIGYVQRVDMSALQKYAEETKLQISLSAIPGTFNGPGNALAYVVADPDSDRDSNSGSYPDIDTQRIVQAFLIGDERVFDNDPRFGLIVLSEIASRALSPAVNDPGTAIDVIGSFVRLFAIWATPINDKDKPEIAFDRVFVPELDLDDMLDDAFTSIARDGAGIIEVGVRLQKAFEHLSLTDAPDLHEVVIRHARLALARAEQVLGVPEDVNVLRQAYGKTALALKPTSEVSQMEEDAGNAS